VSFDPYHISLRCILPKARSCQTQAGGHTESGPPKVGCPSSPAPRCTSSRNRAGCSRVIFGVEAEELPGEGRPADRRDPRSAGHDRTPVIAALNRRSPRGRDSRGRDFRGRHPRGRDRGWWAGSLASLALVGACLLAACGTGGSRGGELSVTSRPHRSGATGRTGTSSKASRTTSSTTSTSSRTTTPSTTNGTTTDQGGCLTSSTPAAASATSPVFTDVQFTSPTVGVVVGTGRILRTENAGATWSAILTGQWHLGEVDFPTADTGFAVGRDHLLGTNDGGTCWQILGEPSGAALDSVHFFSAQSGFGVAGGEGGVPFGAVSGVPTTPRLDGVLVNTTDGGETWSEVESAPSDAQSVCFVDQSTGWLTAADSVYQTTNGGTSWQKVAYIGAPGQGGSGIFVADVSCGAPEDVWVTVETEGAAAGNSPWAVFASSNGTQFSEVAADMYGTYTPGVLMTPGSYPGVISVIEPNVAAVAGITPALLPGPPSKVQVLSASRSELTAAHTVPGLDRPTGLAFVTPDDGWIVGTGLASASGGPATGIVAHTTDGGTSWVTQEVATG
jgi:hypothetical protein